MKDNEVMPKSDVKYKKNNKRNNRRKMLFVYNPHSGRGEIGIALSDILWRFTVSGYDVTVHPTSAPRDGKDYITDNAKDYDIIVSAGGDGMLHELFSGIVASGEDITCGYIPSGTVNDFATSLMISKNPIDAAEIIVNGKIKLIDAGVFNGDIFSYVAAFGLFTGVSYSTDQNMKNALGPLAYLIEALKNMEPGNFLRSSVHAVIKTEDREYEGAYIFGYAGNTLSVGGMTNIIPEDAQMNDGLLDCLFIKTPASIIELDRIRQALMMGRLDIEEIIRFKTNSVEVLTDKPVAWTLDGEYGGKTDKADIGIRNRVIKITVP
ncbi:MAG: YegS/Rv2252/BmrU family lipid kinase [Lachnospiraceae bacterium]|nr:YegS/Rv2252/BmrU family lipid kinase [Lachnospiraceae bacterium]